MQDVLLVKNGKVKYENTSVEVDEDMTATLKSTVVKIGGKCDQGINKKL